MFLSIACRGRYDSRAKILYTIVSSEATGKQAVAIAYREGVISGDTECRKASRHDLGPHRKVLAGVADDRWIAGRAG